MAKFRFRLETLHKLRETYRDELRGKLAAAYQAAQILEEQQQSVAAELHALQATQREAITGNQANVNSLLEAQRYQAVLRAQQATLKGQSKLLAEEIERRRQAVMEADRQVRVLDKLRERQLRQFEEDQRRAEVKQLDEFAVQRWEGNASWHH